MLTQTSINGGRRTSYQRKAASIATSSYLKDIACDNKQVAKILCDLAHDHNPVCDIKADLKQLECLSKDLAHDWCVMLRKTYRLCKCRYHTSYPV